MASQMTKLVYFYSEKDKDLVNKILTSLYFLKKRFSVEFWSKVSAGGEIRLEIIETVKEANIIVYFYSGDFFEDEYDNFLSNLEIDGELLNDWVLKKHTQEKLLFIPILLQNCLGFDYCPERDLAITKIPLGSLERCNRDNECYKIGKNIIDFISKSKSGDVSRALPVKPQPKKTPRSDPKFLPHLCGRGKQSIELQSVFNDYKTVSNETKRPLVFIIHGDNEECPAGYKERIEKREIPEFLQLDYEEPKPPCNLEFPFEIYEIADPKGFFDRTLRERLANTYDAEIPENLTDFLNQLRTLIINYDAFPETWNKRVFESFLEFWNTLALQNTRTTLIINLFFSYEEKSDSDKRSNLEAQRFFDELKENRRANYANIGINVISKLDAINRTEVVKWLNNPKVFRDFCPVHTPEFCDKMTASEQIYELYSNPETPLRFIKKIKFEEEVQEREITLIKMSTISKRLTNMLETVRKQTHS